MLSGGFWLFGAICIVIVVALVIIFAIGLTRASNIRNRASQVDEPNIPRDPTESKAANGLVDNGAGGGNYSRSVPYKQDVHEGQGDSFTTRNRS